MVRRRPTKMAVLAACAGAMVATCAMTAGASAASDRDGRGSDRPAGHTVIVPRGPGESARTLEPGSPSLLEAARRAARSQRANKADKRFVRMMIPHHYQAIVMGRFARKRAADQRVRSIADRIRSEQRIEIATMQGWQGRNGLPVTDERDSYREMLKHPDMLEKMGMATRKQMRRLRRSDGPKFDRKFLRLMIPHHEGAVRMAENVAVTGSDIFIRQLAIDMISAQNRQLHDMRRILEDITSRH